MIPDEIDVPHAVVRVLEEAGIQFVFGMPGGDTGRIFDALYDSTAVQTILVRHEQVGSIMAEMYGRLTGKPGVVMGQGIFLACNALFGTLEAVKGASPMLLLGDFTDMAPFMHHLGWVKDGQRRRGNRFIASELGRYDYARIAQAMGCVGIRVETIKELVGELGRVAGAKEPIVLDVVTTEDAPFWQVQSPFAKEGPGGE